MSVLITPEQSAAYYENRGQVFGEQCEDGDATESAHRCRSTGAVIGTECNQCDGVLDDPSCSLCLRCCDAELIECACVDGMGGDDDCRACDGLLVVTEPNEWCTACGLTGRCPDCDGDAYDRWLDR